MKDSNGRKNRSYSQSTLKILYSLSLNRCYNPDCNENLYKIENDVYININAVAHIIAHSPNGPRADINVSTDELKDHYNLIILCHNCHATVDKAPEIYTTELLHEWKARRESEATSKKINQNNGLIETAIRYISNIDIDSNNYDNNTEIFDVENKINYNNLQRNKRLIDEYKVYHTKIDSIYSELEKINSFKKIKLLKIMKQLYLDELIENYNGTNNINIIRENSDNIFDSIRRKIEKRLSNIDDDDVYIVLPIILVDAFIRCKILEEPK